MFQPSPAQLDLITLGRVYELQFQADHEPDQEKRLAFLARALALTEQGR